jgi:hypothetical protein
VRLTRKWREWIQKWVNKTILLGIYSVHRFSIAKPDHGTAARLRRSSAALSHATSLLRPLGVLEPLAPHDGFEREDGALCTHAVIHARPPLT